ncbi:Protease inhibitor HPI [Linum perenne]
MYVGKNSWPELLGRNGDAAAAVVERENRRVDAVVVREGTPVTDDLRCDRVRVWVNEDRVVTSVPRIG